MNKSPRLRNPQLPDGMNPKVEAFLNKAKKWQDEMKKLRSIMLDCGLTEELKWGKPCYTFQESNLVIMEGLKDSCALLFLKGALLKDAKGILQKPGESSQSARRIPFTDVQEISRLAPAVKAYVREAVEAEKAGVKVEFKKDLEPTPEELQRKLDESPALKRAFTALTPGRQRGYILHFSGAKQAKTRESRIEKCIPQILKGRGFNDH